MPSDDYQRAFDKLNSIMWELLSKADTTAIAINEYYDAHVKGNTTEEDEWEALMQRQKKERGSYE